VATSVAHAGVAVAAASTPRVAVAADLLVGVPPAGPTSVGGLDASTAVAAGTVLPMRDPVAIVAGWAWTAAPAAVGGSWSEAPDAAASPVSETADVSPSLGAGAEAEPLPLGLDRVAASLSVNLAALDAAIERWIGGGDELDGLVADLLAGARPAAWMMGAAAAVAAGVAVHRRAHRRRRTWATEEARDEALNPWALGPVPDAA
jgi:hypothetical protein